MSVNILIADDHEVVRRGVRALIESRPDWRICGEASTGEEALRLAHELKPDIVVVDIGMPQLNGIEVARKMRYTVPRAEILLLTMSDSEQLIREGLEAGARGYVLKSDAGGDLVIAIEALLRHQVFLSPAVATLFVGASMGQSPDAANSSASLSSRERQVLHLLAEGRSNKEVADRLNISVRTAETHRIHIMRKIGAHSITELVHYAVRNRIVQP